MPLVVKLIGARREQVLHLVADGIVGVCPERRCGILLDFLYHFLVSSHSVSPSRSGVELRTVRTCYVGDVPDGVGTRSVLKGGASQSVSEALHHLFSLTSVSSLACSDGGCIPCAGGEIVGIGIPEVRIDIFADVSHLGYVLVVVGG